MAEREHHRYLVARIGRACGTREHGEPREMLRVASDMFPQDLAAVKLRGAARSYACARRIAALDGAFYAAGGVVARSALQVRIGGEKSFALGESGGVRFDSPDRFEGRVRTGDQKMRDRQNYLGRDAEVAFQQQVVTSVHRPDERVLERCQYIVGHPVVDRTEKIVERRERDRLAVLAEDPEHCLVAECSPLA